MDEGTALPSTCHAVDPTPNLFDFAGMVIQAEELSFLADDMMRAAQTQAEAEAEEEADKALRAVKQRPQPRRREDFFPFYPTRSILQARQRAVSRSQERSTSQSLPRSPVEPAWVPPPAVPQVIARRNNTTGNSNTAGKRVQAVPEPPGRSPIRRPRSGSEDSRAKLRDIEAHCDQLHREIDAITLQNEHLRATLATLPASPPVIPTCIPSAAHPWPHGDP